MIKQIKLLAIAAIVSFGIGICSTTPASADYAKPINAVTAQVPAYGVEIGIWAEKFFVGEAVGVFQKNANGRWDIVCFNCFTDPQYPSFDAAVAQAGGVIPFLNSSIVPQINEILARKFPPLGSGPGNSVFEQVGYAIGTQFKIFLRPDGTPGFALK